jgi:septal ring factor EnvC (AmiA/AmiB activator)
VSFWQLLIPKGWGVVAVGGSGAAAGLTFHDTVSLGSVVIALALVIAAGIFSLRNNLKSFWKNLAEERGEQVKQLEREIHEKIAEMGEFAEEQRGLRHQLKNELATSYAALEIERAKHDMSSVFERLDGIDRILSEGSPAVGQLRANQEEMLELLRLIEKHLSA